MRPRKRGSSEPSDAGGAAPAPPSPVEAAIRWLGRRLRFEREVRSFLRKEGFGEREAAEAVARLKDLGLVSDEDTCRAFVRDRLRFAPRGRGLLLAEMRKRGAPEGAAAAALDALLPPDGEVEAATELLRRSARRWRSLPPAEARRRMWSALARRGFPREVAREAIVRAAGEAPGDEGTFTDEDGGAPIAPEEP